MYKTIIAGSIALIAISLTIMTWIVNREDSIRMEIAAQNGLIQCKVANYVLWKKECDNK